MRYAKLSCIESYSFHLQQCPSIDFSILLQDPWPCPEWSYVEGIFVHLFGIFLELSLNFFLEWNMVLGVHVVLGMADLDFLKIMFCPKMGKIGQAQGSLNVQESSVFFLVLYFFISVVYNESLYYCNSCMLEQISYLGKFWFLRYGPKCSWPIRLQDFSINRRTLKLAVSHKEINEINWFLVCPSNSFLRNGSLGFSDFWHNGR